jgi:hypothetical protein
MVGLLTGGAKFAQNSCRKNIGLDNLEVFFVDDQGKS